ncbi:hypothetical protein ABZS76_32990 [Streptomyces sp. NPDC005562]|uniref:hypothetical protein n=1 Tax=Streptomyces sp. NPDC005562 TaxID=3154890 RepID=UPI0033B06599
MAAMMSSSGSPAEQTSGQLTVSYFVYVSAPDEESMQAASNGLKPMLQLGVEQTHTGALTGARVAALVDQLPPKGSGYTGWTVLVTVLVDLDRWNAELGPGQTGADAAVHLRGILESIDISAAEGASLDDVKVQSVIWSPH